MSTAKFRVPRASARPVPDRDANGSLDRFCDTIRGDVRALCASAPGIADLATTFPAMLFALASGYGHVAERGACLEIVGSGGSLRLAAQALGLPWWLRKLPAEAFTTPLTAMPGSAEFGRRIVNHVPTERWKAAGWLDRVIMAKDLVDDDFALWMGWRSKSVPRLRDPARLMLLCAWAWFSRRPDTLGGELVRQPFEAGLGIRRALDEAEAWKKRAELAVALGEGIRDTWYAPGSAGGYDFVPLAKLQDFLAEAAAMDNCLDQFAPRVLLRNSRVFSIRKSGVPVADVEIAPHDEDMTMPVIQQLRGPANRRVVPGVWQATFAWLSQQETRPLQPTRSNTAAARAAARRLWQPYIDAIAGSPGEATLLAFLQSGEVLNPGVGGK